MRFWPFRFGRSRAATPAPERPTKLLVGLGNPGLKYLGTRHNIGFTVLDGLLADDGLDTERKFDGELTRIEVAGQSVVALKPLTFMNRSGACVGPVMTYYSLEASDLIVVHDELDLPLGRLKVKRGGGHGGHNGLRSLIDTVGAEFTRVRCGIGRAAAGDIVGHVLGHFEPSEQDAVTELSAYALGAIECLVSEGELAAMNRFNRRMETD